MQALEVEHLGYMFRANTHPLRDSVFFKKKKKKQTIIVPLPLTCQRLAGRERQKTGLQLSVADSSVEQMLPLPS